MGTSHSDLAAVQGNFAENTSNNLAFAGPDKAGNPQDLSFAKGKRNAIEFLSTAKIFGLQDHFGCFQTLFLVQRPVDPVVCFPTDHHTDKLLLINLLGYNSTYCASVLQNGYMLCHLKYFLQTVGNIKHSDPSGLQHMYDTEKSTNLLGREDSGWLIHYNNFSILHENFGYFYSLLLYNAQILDKCFRI